MTRVQSLLRMNPIIVKELRSRMRGPRAFITLTVSLVLIAGAMYAMLQLMLAVSEYDTSILSPRIGQILFTGLAFLELAIVCAITPAVTAGAISGEIEKQTYEMLQATPLNPTRILWGKLISALSYVFLLLFAGVPMASLVFIFGGVDPRDMAKVLVLLVALAVCFGVLGLFMSALFRRTGRATVASFIVVIALTFIPLFVAAGLAVLQTNNTPPRWVLAPSPISLLSSILGQSAYDMGPLSGFVPILGGWWMQSALSPVSQTSIPRPLYHYVLPLYGGMTLILYLITTRLLQPARRWRLKRVELLTGLAVIAVFAAIVGGLYLATAPRYEWVKVEPTAQPGMPVEGPAVPLQQGGGGGVFMDATPTPLPQQMDPADQNNTEKMSAIYAAVARQLFTKDHTFGDSPPKFPVMYIINKTSDQAGDPTGTQGSSWPLSGDVVGGITEQLKDLGAEVRWVDSVDDVAKDPKSGAVADGGVVITLGNIYENKDDSVKVAGSIYIAGLAGGGNTYLLQEIDGKWTVTGTTGAGWIS